MSRLLICFILLASTLLTACGEESNTNTGTRKANPASIQPSDPELAQTYLQSCFACHSRSISGAPVTGDKEAWAPRLAKGMDTMVNNAINGFRGMPPLGSCMDCDRAEFRALIEFMAGVPAADAPAAGSATGSLEATTSPLLPDDAIPQ